MTVEKQTVFYVRSCGRPGGSWQPLGFLVAGTTKIGYGTTEIRCRGGSRYVKGGFKNLNKTAIN